MNDIEDGERSGLAAPMGPSPPKPVWPILVSSGEGEIPGGSQTRPRSRGIMTWMMRRPESWAR